MEQTYLNGYMDGIMKIASSLSNNIGPSFIDVDCYNKKEFKKEFCKYFNISEDNFEILKTNITLENKLKEWLGDNNQLIESVIYWFNIKYNGEKILYSLNEKIIEKLDNRYTMFYYIEDIFIVECKKYYFVFILGNNE